MGLIWQHNFSTEDKAAIREAIQSAERQTSGEVRVYFEQHTHGESALQRAVKAFAKLKMEKTKDRNGVLFYIAFEDRQFAVLGDQGIHEKVTQVFWESIRGVLARHFAQEAFVEGLVEAIGEVGQQLRTWFPYHRDDVNELPDDPVFHNETPA